MRILILGATGRIGALVVSQALAADHEVLALARSPEAIRPRPRLTIVPGSIVDAVAVGEAVARVDAVVAALGPRANTIEDEEALVAGMRHLVDAMGATGVRRLVALSGAGIDVPGDHKPMIDRLASRVVRRMAGHVVGAKQREFETFSSADLDWTALRPPLVIDGQARGYRLGRRLAPGARVRRADVAAALVDQVADARRYREAPFVLPPR